MGVVMSGALGLSGEVIGGFLAKGGPPRSASAL
jgi:hypothetical protein